MPLVYVYIIQVIYYTILVILYYKVYTRTMCIKVPISNSCFTMMLQEIKYILQVVQTDRRCRSTNIKYVKNKIIKVQ